MTVHKGSTILITGAASGMGLEEATKLAAEGATVWMTDVAEKKLFDARDAIRANGGNAEAAVLDVTDPQAWQHLAESIRSISGILDGLVNNAGRSLRASLVETTDDDWRNVMNVNLDSVFYGMKYCYPLLKESEHASIVNVSSITGMLGYFAPAYGTSKWGVRGLSQSAALEFGAEGIRVNSIHPGLVSSPLLNSGTSEFVDESMKAIPMNRIAEPSEIADVVSFLLSPASSYVTGTEIVIDGGLTSGGVYKQITDRLATY